MDSSPTSPVQKDALRRSPGRENGCRPAVRATYQGSFGRSETWTFGEAQGTGCIPVDCRKKRVSGSTPLLQQGIWTAASGTPLLPVTAGLKSYPDRLRGLQAGGWSKDPLPLDGCSSLWTTYSSSNECRSQCADRQPEI